MSNSILAGVMADDGFVAGVEELGSMDSVAAWHDGASLGEAEAEMETAVAAVEVTDTWVGGVESLIEYMEQNVESGMSAGAAEVVGIQMNHMMAQAGIEKRIVAGVESFQGESSAQAATVAGIEEGDNFLKKVWQSIKNAVYRAITAVKNFFAKLFGGWKKLSAQVIKLKEKADKLDDAYKSKKLEAKNAQHLHVDGKLDPKDIAQGFENLGSAAEKATVLADTYKAALNKAAGKLSTLKDADQFPGEDDLKKIDDAKTAAEKALQSDTTHLPGGVRATTKSKDEDSDQYKAAHNETKDAGNDTAFITAVSKLVKSGLEVNKPDSGRVKANKELDEFSKAEIVNIIDSIDVVCQKAIAANRNVDEMALERKKFVDMIDVMIHGADKGALGKIWDRAKIRWLSRQASKDLTKPVNKFFQYAFTAARAGTSLVSDLV